MPRDLKKFCRIFQWIEKKDKDFAETIEDLCLAGALTPYRGINGITFIMPNDKIKKKIIDLAYSDGNGPNEAVKLIQSLIILDHLPNIESFKSAKKISNRLHILQNVTTNATSATLNDRCTITPVKDFNVLSPQNPDRETNKHNITIWKMSDDSSEGPLTQGEKYIPETKHRSSSKEPSSKPKTPRKVKGAGEFTYESLNTTLIDNYIKNIDAITKNDGLNSPYANFLTLNVKQNAVIDHDPIIFFYLTYLPYTNAATEEKVNVDTNTLGTALTQKTRTKFAEFLNNIPGNIIEDILREQYISSIREEKYNSDKFIDIYEKVYSADAIKKLWQDQFRFLARSYLEKITCTLLKEEKIQIFNKFISFAKNVMPGKDFNAELIQNNTNLVCGIIDVIKLRYKILKKFAKSDDFLYTFKQNKVIQGGGMDSISQLIDGIEGGTITNEDIANFVNSFQNNN